MTKEELRARVLALVLAAVLVWYTSVVPSSAPSGVTRPRRRDDAEGRGGESRRGRAGAAAVEPVEELDWPEFISLD